MRKALSTQRPRRSGVQGITGVHNPAPARGGRTCHGTRRDGRSGYFIDEPLGFGYLDRKKRNTSPHHANLGGSSSYSAPTARRRRRYWCSQSTNVRTSTSAIITNSFQLSTSLHFIQRSETYLPVSDTDLIKLAMSPTTEPIQARWVTFPKEQASAVTFGPS